MPKFLVDIDTHEANRPFSVSAEDVEEVLRDELLKAVRSPQEDIHVTEMTAEHIKVRTVLQDGDEVLHVVEAPDNLPPGTYAASHEVVDERG